MKSCFTSFFYIIFLLTIFFGQFLCTRDAIGSDAAISIEYEKKFMKATNEENLRKKTALLNELFQTLIKDEHNKPFNQLLAGQVAFALHEYGVATSFLVNALSHIPRDKNILLLINEIKKETHSNFIPWTFFSEREAWSLIACMFSLTAVFYMLYLSTKKKYFQLYTRIALSISCTLFILILQLFICIPKKAVAIQPLYARLTPTASASPLFFIPTGHLVVPIYKYDNDWVYIRYDGNKQGYIPISTIKLLNIPIF